jgi:hypothetical protein
MQAQYTSLAGELWFRAGGYDLETVKVLCECGASLRTLLPFCSLLCAVGLICNRATRDRGSWRSVLPTAAA